MSLEGQKIYEKVFREVIDGALFDLEHNGKFDDRSLKEYLPKTYFDKIRGLYGEENMSEQQLNALTNYVHESLAQYQKGPREEYDLKYMEKILEIIEEESHKSSHSVPEELNEVNAAFKKSPITH